MTIFLPKPVKQSIHARKSASDQLNRLKQSASQAHQHFPFIPPQLFYFSASTLLFFGSRKGRLIMLRNRRVRKFFSIFIVMRMTRQYIGEHLRHRH